MSRRTWKSLAPDADRKSQPSKAVANLGVDKVSLEKLVGTNTKVSGLLEEQKRLADNMKRLTGGALNTNTDPRFPVTALDERRKEIEEWATKKEAQLRKYKAILQPKIKQSLQKKIVSATTKFNRPNGKSEFSPNRPLPEKWEERRDRLNKVTRKAKTVSDNITGKLDKFDSVGRQLSDLSEKTGGELPPELASLDKKLKHAREKSAAIKALTRTSALKKKDSNNKTLQHWIEKRDQAQQAIGKVSAIKSVVGSKFNRPAKDISKTSEKTKPKERAKSNSKSDNNSSDLDRRREQSAKKRKEKKAEQDRMDQRNERAKERRKEKKANKYA